MKKILFLINPIAGNGLAPQLIRLLEQSSLSKKYEVTTQTTEYSGHASTLAASAVQQGFDGVIAVGGDGTVNEVASQLVNTSTALGIVPAGSGNGLARHLHYSGKYKTALEQLAFATVEKIDTLRINGRFSVNVSGFGFDGYVAYRFNKEGNRGISNYTKIALKEYFKYPEIKFKIKVDNAAVEADAHMLVIANASQFGNAAIIAPTADLTDGQLDLVIVKRPPLLQMPSTFYRLFTGKLKDNQHIKTYKCQQFIAEANRPVHLHIDGEACEPLSVIDVKIIPKSLNVFLPKY